MVLQGKLPPRPHLVGENIVFATAIMWMIIVWVSVITAKVLLAWLTIKEVVDDRKQKHDFYYAPHLTLSECAFFIILIIQFKRYGNKKEGMTLQLGRLIHTQMTILQITIF